MKNHRRTRARLKLDRAVIRRLTDVMIEPVEGAQVLPTMLITFCWSACGPNCT